MGTSLSIIKEGNTDLNEYEDLVKANDYYAIQTVGEKLYSFFPGGTSLLAVPFIALADIIFDPFKSTFPGIESYMKNLLSKHGEPIEKLTLAHMYQPIELIIASFFCAATALFVFLTATTKLPLRTALLVVFIFAFCSSSWSVSSRALWQHGPSMLMLSIAIYLMILEGRIKNIAKYSAIPLAIAFIVRPTNAIPIAFLTIYLWVNHRHQIISYLLFALPFAVAFFAFNMAVYGTLLPSYFGIGRAFRLDYFFEALMGNLISPSRGLFIYSPILLLGFVWIIRNFSTLNIKSLPLYMMAIIVTHWLVISSFPHWWAGHSYGPRFFADMIPIFMYFIMLFLIDLNKQLPNKKQMIFAAIAPLLAFSFYVNAKGAYFYAVHEWNVSPNNITTHPERLWDWTDIAFLR